MDQLKALAILKSGKNVFLTGSAGTGKTYLLNTYIRYLRDRNVPVAVTASTGIAATHMNGQTIHSWCGMGIKDKMGRAEIEKLKEKVYLKKNMGQVQVLIIDEVSMLHRKQIDLVNLILKRFKSTVEPFGGIQIILSGDFYQLPPVTRENESSNEKFSFMSQAWIDGNFHVCYLDQQFRQDDNALHQILNELRLGRVSEKSKALLKATKLNNLDQESTKLYTHNRDVDRINSEFLDELPGKEFSFRASLNGNLKLAEQLKKGVLAPENLVLKKGAKVMFVKNDRDGEYVNGTMGYVSAFEENEGAFFPVIKTLSGRKIFVEHAKWSIQNEKDSELVSFTQFPLRLGWAITIHKSQGMTLDSAEVDLSKTFERGQGYVAISRLRNLSGMKLLGLNEKALQVDELAWKADFRFRQLSLEVDQSTTIHELEKSFSAFILNYGGTMDSKRIRRKKQSKSKKNKKSTYEKTAELLARKLSLAQIAEERGLAISTIIQHLQKLKNQRVVVDLSSVMPGKQVLNEVVPVYQELLKNRKEELLTEAGNVRLAPLYKSLDGKYEYDTLRLCSLFFDE